MTTSQTAPAVAHPAKRGDLIVIQTHHRDYVIGAGGGAREYDYFQVGVVTNITRNGTVKKWREARDSHAYELDNTVGLVAYWVQSQAEIDVVAAVETAAANPWPHNGMPGMPYGALEDVKAAMKQHRR